MTGNDLRAEDLIALSEEEYRQVIKSWRDEDFLLRAVDWKFWERRDQMAPQGDWRVWLVMAGRGYGKTRMGAEWVNAQANANDGARIALIGASQIEGRQIMVEGESGLLNLPSADGLLWESSLRRVTWKNGAMATLYSGADAEALRGAQHHFAWADEIAKWPDGMAAWDNMSLGLRLGDAPRAMATTTPRPVALIRRLVKQEDVVQTRGRTDDNRHNLPAGFRASVKASYGGTRLGRQELDGELIEDLEGALWSRAMIEACRAQEPPDIARIVIGVDPPGSQTGDACGIVAAGRGVDDKAYVLGDHSLSGCSPEAWARAVHQAAEYWQADRVIAEGNQGGEMVESILRAANFAMPITRVHASQGKSARAEPVAALYESGRAHHAGAFPALEDELCGLMIGGGYEGPGRSPDRADAMVWAMTELMLGRTSPRPSVRLI